MPRRRKKRATLAAWLARHLRETPAEATQRLVAAREAVAAMQCPVCGETGAHRCTS